MSVKVDLDLRRLHWKHHSPQRDSACRCHMLWPPREPGGYSLIVDGHGEVRGDGLCVTPARAVLYRSAAPGTPSASGCDDDCVPLS